MVQVIAIGVGTRDTNTLEGPVTGALVQFQCIDGTFSEGFVMGLEQLDFLVANLTRVRANVTFSTGPSEDDVHLGVDSAQ